MVLERGGFFFLVFSSLMRRWVLYLSDQRRLCFRSLLQQLLVILVAIIDEMVEMMDDRRRGRRGKGYTQMNSRSTFAIRFSFAHWTTAFGILEILFLDTNDSSRISIPEV